MDSYMLFVVVKVDRTKTLQQLLDATGRVQYVTPSVVNSLQHGQSDEVELCFFRVGRQISDDDLEKEYALRRLRPVDPFSLAQFYVNLSKESSLGFACFPSNATHWKGADGKWYSILFSERLPEERVFVRESDSDWRDDQWFTGVRIAK